MPNIEKAKIYGVDLVGSSDPYALRRTDDAIGLSYTVGDSDIESDFDRCYPWCDMQEVMDEHGNVFIKIPKFYTKVTKSGEGDTYWHQISGIRYDGFSTLFIDGKGNEIDYVLVGKYEGSGSASQIYSKSGQSVLANISLDNFRTGCMANGAGYQQYDFLIDLIIKELFLVEFARMNSQSIMYGYANDNAAAIGTGRTDSVRTPSGSHGDGAYYNRTGKSSMKYRGIENLWGNVNAWCDGIYFNARQIYVCTDPLQYAGRHTSAYVYQGERPEGSNSVIVAIAPLGRHPLIQYVTEERNVPETTVYSSYFYCDKTYYGGDSLIVGGNWSGGTYNAGLWYWDGGYNSGSLMPDIGGRLCYKPI